MTYNINKGKWTDERMAEVKKYLRDPGNDADDVRV